ncbi:hypothetical protein O1R50_10145 [Glycomyces luteolus]|uniref:Uncharacterized protein n=1 Tax=Glycomyces luteolus TaxID=2670330 RepID=A0A9X3P9C5_9ACTN|nr:hypothetical protein [Glycomyces luteolus]MDA1359986.1 hypothetical protein [Glycomyces luteolus]
MGLFGAIGREARGAFRSLGYDLRQSRRFRRAGAIAVVAVAGGMIATGALLCEPVPGLQGLGGEGSDITDGWFGLGADTTGQDAESSEQETSHSPSAAEEADDPEVTASSPSADAPGKNLGDAPGLVPIGEETSDSVEEHSPTPTEEPTEEPTDGPTTDAPTETPTEEPTTDAPTTAEPTPSASLPTSDGPTQELTAEPTSDSSSAQPSAEQAPRGSTAPIPRKGAIGD